MVLFLWFYCYGFWVTYGTGENMRPLRSHTAVTTFYKELVIGKKKDGYFDSLWVRAFKHKEVLLTF